MTCEVLLPIKKDKTHCAAARDCYFAAGQNKQVQLRNNPDRRQGIGKRQQLPAQVSIYQPETACCASKPVCCDTSVGNDFMSQ